MGINLKEKEICSDNLEKNCKEIYNPPQEESNLQGVESQLKENEYAERNKVQKKIRVNEETINIIFGNGDETLLNSDICYYKILNLCRKGITKYFKTRDFAQKEELAYICVMRLYRYFKKMLQKLKEEGKEPELFFYMSRFFQYIDITARNVVGVYWRKEKNRSKFMEFKEGVNYSQPLKDILGRYDIDFSNIKEKSELAKEEQYKQEDIENFISESDNASEEELENELNNIEPEEETEHISWDEKSLERAQKEVKRCISMNVSAADLKQIHLDNELDKRDSEINIDSYLKNNNFFDDEEKKLIKSIYLGYKKEDIFYNQFKKKVDSILENLDKNNAQDLFFMSFDQNDLREVLFNLTLSCAKRKYSCVLKRIREKLNDNVDCLGDFLSFVED